MTAIFCAAWKSLLLFEISSFVWSVNWRGRFEEIDGLIGHGIDESDGGAHRICL